MKRVWSDVVALHESAAADYAATARVAARDDGLWCAAPEPGKWSPAEITQHLNLAFVAACREVTDGVPMRLRTRAWHRLILRFTIQRRLMRGGPFPRGARSPREARPEPGATGSATALITRFKELGGELLAALERERVERPDLCLTHPYFGSMPAADMVYVSARHIQHHDAQLRAIIERASR